jgi:hypothetical protein
MADATTRTRMEALERTVLELGAELYNLKGRIAKQGESHEQFLSIIKGLKQLLDEKGLITVEDFDAAVELGEALEAFAAQTQGHHELEKDKKSGH